jgi:hypothetical protein
MKKAPAHNLVRQCVRHPEGITRYTSHKARGLAPPHVDGPTSDEGKRTATALRVYRGHSRVLSNHSPHEGANEQTQKQKRALLTALIAIARINLHRRV